MRKEVRGREKRHETQDFASLLEAGNKKLVSKHLKKYAFKSMPPEFTDDKRIKKIAAGKDPDKMSRGELRKAEKEAAKEAHEGGGDFGESTT